MTIVRFKGKRKALQEQIDILTEMNKRGYLCGLIGVAVLRYQDDGEPGEGKGPANGKAGQATAPNLEDLSLSVFWADSGDKRQDLTYVMLTGLELVKRDFLKDNFE